MDKNRSNLINNIFEIAFSRKTLLVLIVLTALGFIFSMYNRYIYIDDAFFAEQSYYLAHDGVVKIPSFIDFAGCENHLFSYHKLNIFVGAGLIKLFGLSITPLRVISILFTLGLLFIVYRYVKDNQGIYRKEVVILALFLIVVNPLIVWYAFTFRPEIWVTFFGFVSFYFIHKTINGNETKSAMWAGILAGLAVLTHLNGIMFPAAGFFTLLLYRKYKPLLIFTAVTSLVSVLYLWDLWQDHNFATWIFQLKSWPENNGSSYMSGGIFTFLKNALVKLSEEHQRFFWSDKVWGMSLLFLFSIIAKGRMLVKEYKVLLIYTIFVILSLNVLGTLISERFYVYYIPFLAVIISVSISSVLSDVAIWKKGVYVFLLLVQLVFVAYTFKFLYVVRGNYVERQTSILNHIEDKKSRVLAPYEFVFNGLETHNLVSFKGIEYYEAKIHRRLTQQDFYKHADSLNIKYIVLPTDVHELKYNTLPCLIDKEKEENSFYKPFFEDSTVLILKATR